MPVVRVCTLCQRTFLGRVDAEYCTSACRQKAYRRRNRRRASTAVLTEAVPDGDEWMRDRFGHGRHAGSLPLAEHPNGGPRSARHRAPEDPDGLERIRDYVQGITYIGRELYDAGTDSVTGQDLTTPLGNALPAELDPAIAARLAADLKAAVPRVNELASLLDRRARMTDSPLPMKIPLAPPDW